MIKPGNKYTPVCRRDNGVGNLPGYVGGDHGSYRVIPYRYPWQTPVGVLATDLEAPDMPTITRVIVNGKFELHFHENDIDDSDIYGEILGNYGLIGMRVYYDYDRQLYVLENNTNIDAENDPADQLGTYAGAATIGYISDHRIDPDDNDAGWVTVTIDPRPARATYKVCCFSGTAPAVGMPVTILAPTRIAVPFTPATYGNTCDGVIAGILTNFDEGAYWVVVCTSGPAWILLTKAMMYDLWSKTELRNAKYPAESAPINANFAISPMQHEGDNEAPIIGYARMAYWYDHNPTLGKYKMVIDIDPEAPTLAATGGNTDLSEIRYYDDPEAGPTIDGNNK